MDTLLYAGLANAVIATVLALAVAGATRLGRRPALAHALWLLVLLKLITPPFLAVSLPWALPIGTASADGEAALAREPPAPLAEPVALPPSAPGLPGAEIATDGPPDPAPAAPLALPPEPAPATASPFPLQGVIGGLWLAGSLAWWTVAAWRVARFRRLLRHAAPASADVQEQAGRLARRLGLPACPGVWLVPVPLSPLLWALGRSPRLLLPAGLWDRLTPDQRDTLLAHELAHLRRRDHWVRRLELVVLGLYWWHPVAWWARHEIQEAEEQCCDAWVVWTLPAAAPAYAAALVETVAFLSQTRRPLPLAASGVGHVQTLKGRLTMILRQPAPRALSGAGLLTVLGLAALLLPLLPTWAEPLAADPPAQRRADPDPKQPDPRAAADRPLTITVKPQTHTTVTRYEIAVQDPKAPRPSQPKVLTPAERDLADRVQEARDEVALVEAQLQVKQAQLRAAKVALNQATEHLRRLQELYEKGAVAVSVFTKAKDDVAAAQAQLPVKEAELREPEIRLQQARRRLARLLEQVPSAATPVEKAATKSAPPAATKPDGSSNSIDDRRRLRDVEKKLDRLLEEVESLRKQIRAPAGPKGANVPPTKGQALYYPAAKAIDLPVMVDPKKRDKISRVILYVSADEGRTWKQAAAAGPEAQVLTFVAPADGLYWFQVAAVDRDGNQDPADITKVQPAYQLRVGSGGGGN